MLVNFKSGLYSALASLQPSQFEAGTLYFCTDKGSIYLAPDNVSGFESLIPFANGISSVEPVENDVKDGATSLVFKKADGSIAGSVSFDDLVSKIKALEAKTDNTTVATTNDDVLVVTPSEAVTVDGVTTITYSISVNKSTGSKDNNTLTTKGYVDEAIASATPDALLDVDATATEAGFAKDASKNLTFAAGVVADDETKLVTGDAVKKAIDAAIDAIPAATTYDVNGDEDYVTVVGGGTDAAKTFDVALTDAAKGKLDGAIKAITFGTLDDQNRIPLTYTPNVGDATTIYFDADEFLIDSFLKDAEFIPRATADDVTAAGENPGFVDGDPVIKFTFVERYTDEGGVETSHDHIVYLPAKDLVNEYTPGTGITITNNEIANDGVLSVGGKKGTLTLADAAVTDGVGKLSITDGGELSVATKDYSGDITAAKTTVSTSGYITATDTVQADGHTDYSLTLTTKDATDTTTYPSTGLATDAYVNEQIAGVVAGALAWGTF